MSDEEWVRNLDIPAMALPGLRDLRIQFVALLVFDLKLGPVAYINEISRGSSYIKKLKSHQTLSEVYAGVANSPQYALSTLEEDIAVFRYQPKGMTDIKTVFFISCIPNSELEPIRKLGRKALFNAKGKPEEIGKELYACLREESEKKFKRIHDKTEITILDNNQPIDPLELIHIKGLLILDIESKLADIRNLPIAMDGNEIEPEIILEYVDNQIRSIVTGSVTSMIYQNIPFLASKVRGSEIYMLFSIHDSSFVMMRKISKWLIPFVEILGKEWKQASQQEILAGLTLFDQAEQRNTPKEYLMTYCQMLIRSDRIKPSKGMEEPGDIEPPMYINQNIWEKLDTLDGSESLTKISENWELDLIDTVTLFEWARVRNLVVFLSS